MKLTDIIELNKIVSRDLFLLGNEKSGVNSVFSPFLVFPELRGTHPQFRVSEQEARALYIRKLNELGLYHSVETPTTEVYSFTGSSKISGNIDLTIYDDKNENDKQKKSHAEDTDNKNDIDTNAFERDVNVEFKAGNCDKEKIRKDMEKFAGEEVPGNWFHVLRNVDSGTFTSLFKKFVDCMDLFIMQPLVLPIEEREFIFTKKNRFLLCSC